MGYTTYFEGEFTLDRPLANEHRKYLEAFSGTRRMRRNPELTAERPDPVREAAGLDVGPEGAYFVGGGDFRGQEHSEDVVGYNDPPKGQPGLWCQWVPDEAGTVIQHDEGEKFYSYVEWIEYLIQHFLAPWGYTLSGEVTWSGEEQGDMGKIVIEANAVSVKVAKIVFED
jgi:hypothetical protein